jgi:hypothetical protein
MFEADSMFRSQEKKKKWGKGPSVLALSIMFFCVTTSTFAYALRIPVETGLQDYAFSTYLGGSAVDCIIEVAVDSEGNIVVVGGTYSMDIPIMNAVQEEYGGGVAPEHLYNMGDNYVAKFSSGGELLWASYFGGSGLEESMRVRIGDNDEVVFIGITDSEDFPVTEDAIQTSYGGGDLDGFLAVLSSDGALLYSSYLGGSGSENLADLSIDPLGNIIIVGSTDSTDFPVTPDAHQSDNQGLTDAIIIEIEANREAIGYSTFFGGADTDAANEVELDSEGSIVLTGTTMSGDFPTSDGAFKESVEGDDSDSFVAKFQRNGDLQFSTLLGGDNMDQCLGLGVDPSDIIYIVGRTWSVDFPTTSDALQETFSATSPSEDEVDGFYTKVSPEWELLYSTYYGATGWDSLFQVGFHEEDAVVIGFVNSDEFTMINAFQGDFRGVVDGVLLVFDAEREVLLSSYLGGTQMDNPRGLFVTDGKVHIVGDSNSPDFYTTDDAFQESIQGEMDGFIFTLELDDYLQNVNDIQVPDYARIKLISNLTSYGIVIGAILVWILVMKRFFQRDRLQISPSIKVDSSMS